MTRSEANAVVYELRRSLRSVVKVPPTRWRGWGSDVRTRLRNWLRNAFVALAVLAVIASCVVGAASAHAGGLT